MPADQLYPLLQGIAQVNAVTCIVGIPHGGKTIPTRVPGLAITLADAAWWLMHVDQGVSKLVHAPRATPGPQSAAADGPGFRPGASFHAWYAAVRLLLRLLAQGRLLPRLRVEAGCLTTRWEVAPGTEEAEQITALAGAMPLLCPAIVPPDRSHAGYRPAERRALLLQFLREAANALAQRFLTEADRPLTPLGGRSALRHWLLALAGQAPADIPPGLEGAQELYAAVGDWEAPASELRSLNALRSGLRLNPPGESETGGWEIELVLQTTAEPMVIIPADALWEAVGEELVAGPHRYEGAEQRLLADLPAMVRLFPPLERAARTPAPARMPVRMETVLDLLQEGAARLQEAGFAVLLPAGLVRPAELKATLRLKPMASHKETRFGLEQTVAVDWELALGGQAVDWEQLERLAKEKALLVQSQGGWIQVDPKAIQAALRNLEPNKKQIELRTAVKLAAQSGQSGQIGQAGAVEPDDARAAEPDGQSDPSTLVAAVTGEGWIADLLDRLQRPARIEPIPAPRGLQATLRPYQERGFHWLAFLRRYGLGAILADDMGLGKTIQIIALLLHEREEGLTDHPTLLVCPVSLVGNWRRELSRFAPSLRVLIHHGSGRAGEGELRALALEYDLVITTYALAARDEAELSQVAWAGVVVDEAQNLKNPSAKHAQALRRMSGGYRIAMSGTPVENQLGDLWALFQFTDPGLLGSQDDFRKRFALPIERDKDKAAAGRLRTLIQPFMLRRLKTDPTIIDDLPEKQEGSVYVNLTMEQAALYEAVVQQTIDRSLGLAGIARHGAVLSGLTRLKQVCNHPAGLVDDGGPMEGRSGKLDRLTEMLEEVLAGGDSALIFTQFAQFGARLRDYLARRFGCAVHFLDGSVDRLERERLIQSFQAGEAPIFVLSLKAGGVGLNLTRANHVFHFDRWWNPAVEDQATDRAFRIGQTQRVMVHRLVTAGTLEERIDELLTEKRQLSGQVVGTGESWLGDLSTDELRRLIALEREG